MAIAESQVPFSIVDISGKGQGLVATDKLVAGTILLTEKPLIVVDTAAAVHQVLPQFHALSDDQKTVVLSLYDPGEQQNPKYLLLTDEEMERKVFRIFEANCIDLCSHQEMNINKSGLYQTISKINHSCCPNVVWTWIKKDSAKSIKQVRVIKSIQVGEEIVASYLGKNEWFPTREQRISDLQKKWFFTCTCQVCNLTGEELKTNENTRLEIQRLHDAIPVQASTGRLADALDSANKKLKLMKTLKKELVVEIPGSLMEIVELATHLKKSADNLMELKNKAEELSKDFGDVHLFNFNKKWKKIQRIQ